MDEIRLGTVLLEGGIVDEAALERCLAIQSVTGGSRPIGQILVEQGLLDEPTLQRLLELQGSRIAASHAGIPATDLSSAPLLTAATLNGASELVVSEGGPVRIRVGMSWQQLTEESLTGPEVWDFVRETMGPDLLEQHAEHLHEVRRWQLAGIGSGSATVFRHFGGVAIRLTFAPQTIETPYGLGVPDAVTAAVEGGKGLILCVGDRAHGRAELLASLTKHAAKGDGQYVVVVDDEAGQLPESNGLITQRRYGIDPQTQSQVLRSVVREDPDVMVIADVGSPETFEVALRAAEGGCLVIAYLDSKNVVGALKRIFNFYPSYELPRVRFAIAAVLRTVLVRQLLPNAERTATVAATELLVVNDAVGDVIRSGELHDLGLLLRAESGPCGYPLDRSMLDLLGCDLVTLDEVFVRAEEKAWVLERARHLKTSESPEAC